jgi:hypothetical protein
MGRVVIAQSPSHEVVPFPEIEGLINQGAITYGVIDGADRPLLLWMHELNDGASVTFLDSPIDHLLYVFEGAVETDADVQLRRKSTVIVERGGGMTLSAKNNALLLHFHRAVWHPDRPSRAGGGTHLMLRGDAPKARDESGMTHTLMAGADCPNCELWLHSTEMEAEVDVPRHYHSEDEIITVVSGALMLGRRAMPPGSAIAVDKETVYKFRSGSEGLEFINFRANNSTAVVVDGDRPAVDEGEHLRNLFLGSG